MKQIRESHLRSRTGFALPLTIFLVSIISVMLATTFTRAATEHLVAGSTASEVTVLAVAQSGLQAFLGDTNIVARPVPPDSFRYNVAGGYAWVKPEPMQIPTDTLAGTFQYIVQSTGYHIVPAQGSTPQARRSVAQFALFQAGLIRPTGAYTAANGIYWDPPGGYTGSDPTLSEIVIDGNDAGISCVPIDTTGFRGPELSAFPGGLITGNLPIQTGATPGGVAVETGVDWEGIVSGGMVVPDYTVLTGGDPSFPTYLIVGDGTGTNISGTGLLIVTGHLRPDGSFFNWEGLILVGGRFDTQAVGASNIEGQLVTGLNWIRLVPTSVPQQFIRYNGNHLTVQYNSCKVRDALRRYAGFVPLENTWIDNWSTY